MSLWKRGNVYWSYVYLKGVRYHKSTKTGNRRQAELAELEFKKELQEKQLRPVELNPEMSFGELAARFLADAKVRPHHIDRLKMLLPHFSDMPLYRINRAAAQDFRNARHRQKKISETTVNRDIEVLRHIMYWATDQGILLTNPLSRVRLERERRKPRPVLAIPEEQALLKAASPHLREIIVTALDTGMRRGELLSQVWEHVDLARRLLSVTKSKTAGG